MLTSALSLTILQLDTLTVAFLVTLGVLYSFAPGDTFSVATTRIFDRLIARTLALRPLGPFGPLWTTCLITIILRLIYTNEFTFGTNRRGDFCGTDFRLIISPTSFALWPLKLADREASIEFSFVLIETALLSFDSLQFRLSKSHSSFELVANILFELPLAM